jgi:nucleotide-binding universal stress UspA family protein
MKKILVPLTLSSGSHAALAMAAYFAQACDARIVLLHALQPGLAEEGGASAAWALPLHELTHPAVGDDVRSRGDREFPLASSSDGVEEQLDAIAAAVRPRVPVEIIVRSGWPAAVIVQQAKALAADAIVMCTHGYLGWRKWLHRNTARHVARHAPCAVWQLSPATSLSAFTVTLANCHPVDWLLESAHPLRPLLQILFPGLSAAGAGQAGIDFHFIVKPSQTA